MKHYKSSQLLSYLLAHADDIRALHATEHGRDWLFLLFSYTWNVNSFIDRDTLVRHLAPVVGPELEHTMLTYGQKLDKQGYDRGHKDGREDGLKAGAKGRTVLP